MDSTFEGAFDGVFDWVVVGAGPAGIAAVGQLIESGVDSHRVAWIDPHFTVGDFGASWRLVISNTPVDTFMKYFREIRSFQFSSRTTPFDIEKMAPLSTCPLAMVAAPLQWITDQLKARVTVTVDHAVSLACQADVWRVTLGSGSTLRGHRVILAIGAEPKRLPFAGLAEISLKTALNPLALRRQVQRNDHVAVFGDAQSARSTLQNLLGLGVAKISHFFHSKSSVVRHLKDVDLSGVRSMPDTTANLLATIPHCTKVVYAAGFERRSIQIDGLPDNFGYDSNTGIIGPGLYGLGIAFPEVLPHELGRAEYRVVAIWPILKHLQRCLPIWSSQPGVSSITSPDQANPPTVDTAPANTLRRESPSAPASDGLLPISPDGTEYSASD